MTLEEKIDAFVLAQGNQVGAGAELAGILKELAGGMINIPVITEEEIGHPVSQNRMDEILASAIVRYGDELFCLCTDLGTITEAVETFIETGAGYLYTNKYSSSAGALNSLEGLVLYYGEDGLGRIYQYSV